MRVSTVLFLCCLVTAIPATAQDVPGTAAPTLAELPRHVISDFARLGTRTPALTLGIGAALALAVHPRDHQTVTSVSGDHSVEEALDAGSVAGNGWMQAGAAVATYVVGRWSGHRTLASVGGDLVEAQIVAGVLTQGIKFAAERTRPDGGRYSFPSGHSSATFATAGVIEERFGWRYGLAAYAGAAYVAASRVADRRHYLSDVIFGAAIGSAAAHTLRLSTGQHWALWPGVTAHSVGVTGVFRFDAEPVRNGSE